MRVLWYVHIMIEHDESAEVSSCLLEDQQQQNVPRSLGRPYGFMPGSNRGKTLARNPHLLRGCSVASPRSAR